MRYEDIPEAERRLAESEGWGKPNSYVRGGSLPTYYPAVVADFLRTRIHLIAEEPDA